MIEVAEDVTKKTYARMTDLVTTTDGVCPEGFAQVELTLLAPGLRDLVRVWMQRSAESTAAWAKTMEDLETTRALLAKTQAQSDQRLRDLVRVQGDFNTLAQHYGGAIDAKLRAEKLHAEAEARAARTLAATAKKPRRKRTTKKPKGKKQ